MSQDSLKRDLEQGVTSLEAFSKKLNAALDVLKRTYTAAGADGSNGSAIDQVVELLDHDFVNGQKIKPLLNHFHQVLWKDAKANLEAKRRAENDALADRAPALYKPRTKKEPIAAE